MNDGMRYVLCLDTGEEFFYLRKTHTAYQALESVRYMLDLERKDDGASIEMHGAGRTLSFVHLGNTYATIND